MFIFFLLINIYVIGPKFAQHTLNDSNIVFRNMVIGEVSPDGKSFANVVEAVLSNTGPFSATVAPMDMYLLYKGQKVGHVKMPEVVITGGAAVTIKANSTFFVTDSNAFTQFSYDLVREAEVQLELSAKADLTAHMGISLTFSGLDFDKTVTLVGLSGMKEFKILKSDPGVRDDSYMKVGINVLLS